MQTSPQNSISRSTRNRNINHAVKQKCLLKWSTSETVESTLETLPACHATWPGVHTERTATEGALWWLGQKSARIHLGQWIYRFFLLKKSMAFYTCEVSHYQAWQGDVVPITMGPPYPRTRHPDINIHRCRAPSLGGGVSEGLWKTSELVPNTTPRRFYGPWNLVSVGVEVVQEWISHGYRGPMYLEVVAS